MSLTRNNFDSDGCNLVTLQRQSSSNCTHTMSSTRASFLSTPVSEFIDYLNGKTMSAYEDSAEKLLNVLSSSLEILLYQRYHEFVSLRIKDLKEGRESELIEQIDVVNFLIEALPSIHDIFQPGPLHTAFSQLNKSSFLVLCNWLNEYRKSELETLRNPYSQTLLSNMFSQSPVFSLVYSLLEGGRTSLHNIDDETLAQKCNEIKEAISNDLMEYLRRLSIVEAVDLKHTSRGGVVSGGPNQQDATSQDIEHSEWFHAWEEEFRGSALENLEVKLSLNVQALRTGRKDKIDMSHIIPIVQSSDTEKNRLAEQYASNETLD